MRVAGGVGFMYDVCNDNDTERRGTMQVGHDTIEVKIRTINGVDYVWPHELSDELKEMLKRELEFGVNLPQDQEFELRAMVTMRHHV